MSNQSSVLVLDPGHGGAVPVGASSANRAVSASGLLERDLALDLALRVRDRLVSRVRVVLTRDSDCNLSLADRARIANEQNADIFLSLHFNGDSDPSRDETVAFVARDASRASKALAQAVADRVSLVTLGRNRGVQPRDLGVLVLKRHAARTASALVEIGHLTNPRQAGLLERSDYRDTVARAIAEAVETSLPNGARSASLDTPPFTIAKSVGANGKNLKADVEVLKRRLVSLGFNWITVNDSMDNETIRVIRLFQSIVHGYDTVSEDNSGVDGTVSVPGNTLSWLQAPNAPQWQTMPGDSAGFENFELADTTEDFDFGTDWLASTLVSAGARYKKDYLDSHAAAARLSLNDASLPHGQSTRDHKGHQTGLMGDLRLPRTGGKSGEITHADALYDRAAARAQLKALRAEPLHSLIFFNDATLIGEGLCKRADGHDNHFHFQIKPPAMAAGASLNAGGAKASALSNTPVVYAGGRNHVPTADAALFRTAPDPIAVTAATLLPEPSTTADADLRDALTAIGATGAEMTAFEHGGGLVPLRPFADVFGGAALQELMRRLRYTKRQILRTPHTYGAELARKLGVSSAIEILAPRLLLAIPGHFRELARRTTDEREAFALENFGWLFMGSVRDAIRTRMKKNWWVPPSPVFVTPFSSSLPSFTTGVQRMILRSLLIDTTLSSADYNAHFNNWKNGLAGRQWRMETGVDPASPGAGRPFYPQLLNIPAGVNIAAQKTQIDQAWRQRRDQTDAKHPVNSAPSTAALIQCENDRLEHLGLTEIASLGGLELVYDYPKLEPAKAFTKLPVLTVIKPTFEQFCSTVHELGWNDLLFQTQGAFCFRGTKISGNAAGARNISNHGYGIAYDVMNHENEQGQRHATTDPRIVAVFEAFHFQWGLSFPTPDPMHFDYHP